VPVESAMPRKTLPTERTVPTNRPWLPAGRRGADL
jgi:hypothetical protein